jgi:hypothetical protein
MPLLYDKTTKRWTRQEPLDPAIKYAAELPSGRLFTIRDDGPVQIGDKVISDAASLALHHYGPEKSGYPIMHSGEAPPCTSSNDYDTGAWMGNAPDPRYGTPIYIGVSRPDRDPVRYLLHFAGAVLTSEPDHQRGIDNHCLPQLFVRESDKRIVYLSGAHHGTIYAGVSGSPHAGYNFHRLHPVGPLSDHPANGHTYPAARLVGDTLHVVSRLTTNGYKWCLIYWRVNTLTMQTDNAQVLDVADDDAKYAIWYQQPRVERDTLIIDTSRRWRPKDKPDTFLTDPEPKRFEIKI